MATSVQQQPYRGGSGYVARSSSSGLYDVLELILDKGLVIDVFVRVSLIGIEILTIDARIVIASVDTYLRFAEAVNRLDLMESSDSQGLPDMMDSLTSGGASSKTKGVLQGAKEALFGDEEDEGEDDEGEEDDDKRSRRRTASSTTTKRRRRSAASGSGSGSSRRSKS
ncbi:MAG: gas vesicle protein GvpJ [Solirubrobacterales bacterium]